MQNKLERCHSTNTHTVRATCLYHCCLRCRRYEDHEEVLCSAEIQQQFFLDGKNVFILLVAPRGCNAG
jgi:hypothetical protein